MILRKKKGIMLWNMLFGLAEKGMSSRKKLPTLCGGIRTDT